MFAMADPRGPAKVETPAIFVLYGTKCFCFVACLISQVEVGAP